MTPIRRKLITGRLLVAAAAVAAVLAFEPAERHVASIALLRLMNAHDSRAPSVAERALTDLEAQGENVNAKIYGPSAGDARMSIVLAHGIHHEGIAERRLVQFARQLASVGCRVLTPELPDLRAYRISQRSVGILRSSVSYLARDGGEVGLIGFSFTGGLSLLAAADPKIGRQLDYVASIGGHHDLERTLRFLLSHQAMGPNGTRQLDAHEYGLLVLIYGQLRHLELGADEAIVADVIRAWLDRDRPRAKRRAEQLATAAGKRIYSQLATQQLSQLSPSLLPWLRGQRGQLLRLSPRGRLKNIPSRVLLVHGEADDVVPYEETLWAIRELERTGQPFQSLITPLLGHVGVQSEPSLLARARLVHMMAQLM